MTFFRQVTVFLFCLLSLSLSCTTSFASVVLNGTRFIYPGDKKEITVMVTNNNKTPVLIQNWLDNGNERAEPGKTTVPFVLTPPINRVDQGKGQSLRISYLGVPALPADKESVFWLNVLEIPAKQKTAAASDSKLNIAFRTRVKIFYRPVGLAGTPGKAAEGLRWTLQNGEVKVINSSNYHVSLSTITYQSNGKNYEERARMIAPGSTDTYRFKGVNISALANLSYTVINDYGGMKTYKAKG